MSRYIDAENPIQIVTEYKVNTARMTDDEIDVDDVLDMFSDMIDDFENIPTADVRENIKGEWHDYQEGKWIYQRCSVCGYDYAPRKYPFCPNCGADMRGEA